MRYVAYSLLAYGLLTVIGHYSPSRDLSIFIFSLSVLTLVIAGGFNYLYFKYLLTEKIPTSSIVIVILIIIAKSVALYVSPIKVMKVDHLYVREAHLYPPSVFITYLIILLITYETVKLLFAVWRKKTKQDVAKKLTGVYLLLLMFMPIIALGREFFLLSVFLSFIQALYFSAMVFYLYYLFKDKAYSLALLPVRVISVLLHTYGGLNITARSLDPEHAQATRLVSSLLASLVTIETSSHTESSASHFNVYALTKYKLIVFFGKMIIGSIIADKDNLVLRQILKNIVETLENKVVYLDEGMITNIDIELAEKVIDKFKMFLT